MGALRPILSDRFPKRRLDIIWLNISRLRRKPIVTTSKPTKSRYGSRMLPQRLSPIPVTMSDTP